MLALFVAGLETPGKRLILAVLLIATGTAIASYGEVKLSWVGVACMMASETFEATRLVMTQILLVGLKFHPGEQLPPSLYKTKQNNWSKCHIACTTASGIASKSASHLYSDVIINIHMTSSAA